MPRNAHTHAHTYIHTHAQRYINTPYAQQRTITSAGSAGCLSAAAIRSDRIASHRISADQRNKERSTAALQPKKSTTRRSISDTNQQQTGHMVDLRTSGSADTCETPDLQRARTSATIAATSLDDFLEAHQEFDDHTVTSLESELKRLRDSEAELRRKMDSIDEMNFSDGEDSFQNFVATQFSILDQHNESYSVVSHSDRSRSSSSAASSCMSSNSRSVRSSSSSSVKGTGSHKTVSDTVITNSRHNGNLSKRRLHDAGLTQPPLPRTSSDNKTNLSHISDVDTPACTPPSRAVVTKRSAMTNSSEERHSNDEYGTASNQDDGPNKRVQPLAVPSDSETSGEEDSGQSPKRFRRTVANEVSVVSSCDIIIRPSVRPFLCSF